MANWGAGLQTAGTGAQIGGNFGIYGAIGGAIGGFIDGLFGGPLSDMNGSSAGGGSPIKLKKIKLDPMSKSFDDFFSQEEQFPKLDEVSNKLNTMFQEGITKVAPDYFNTLNTISSNTASLAKGVLPPDVLAKAMRDAGMQNFAGGFAGTEMGSANVARQLGLTSLDLENQALTNESTLFGLAKAASPVNPINLIFTPQAIQSRSDQVKALNSGRANQQMMVNYGIQQQQQANDLATISTLASLFASSGRNSSSSGMAGGYFGQPQSSMGGYAGVFSNLLGALGSIGGSGGGGSAVGGGSGYSGGGGFFGG